jgi:ornithine carbamoyltransferase
MVEVSQHLKGRSFTRINDWSHDELKYLLDVADELKALRAGGEPHRLLPGRTIGLIFELASTRARVSFAVAAEQLGASTISLEREDTRLGHVEALRDTAETLSRYLDALVYRTRRQEDIDHLAAEASIPVINGLTETTNPCQALGDVMTIRERLGRLSGVKVAYVGDGNNVCRSLMRAAAKFGMCFFAATPAGYTPAQDAIDQTRKAAIQQGGTVEFTHDPRQAVERAEVVYTAAWRTVGREDDDARLAALREYRIDDDLLELADPEAFLMHCLPARYGEEISEDLLYGPRSAVWDQAENRLHTQKALLALVVR